MKVCPLETVEQQRVVAWADHQKIGNDTIGQFLFAIPMVVQDVKLQQSFLKKLIA